MVCAWAGRQAGSQQRCLPVCHLAGGELEAAQAAAEVDSKVKKLKLGNGAQGTYLYTAGSSCLVCGRSDGCLCCTCIMCITCDVGR